jgi:hypothetical protein
MKTPTRKSSLHRENDMAGEFGNVDRRTLRRLFAGLQLSGAIRMAFDLRTLTIAALGLASLRLGWAVLDRLFPSSASVTTDPLEVGATASFVLGDGPWRSDVFRQLNLRLSEPFRNLIAPLLALFDPRSDWAAMLHAMLALAWLFVIGGICGGAICRIAMVRVAALRQTGIVEALRFSLRSAGSLILAPCFPFFGLAFCAAVLAGFGVVYRLPVVGSTLVGVLFVIPLALGLIMTLLVAEVAAGWPMLQASIAAGAEDPLDAVSRTFGYLNQRIGSFVLLAGFAWLQGMLGIFLVDLLAGGVIRLTEWGLGLSSPAAQMAAIFAGAGEAQSSIAAAAHAFWMSCVRLVEEGWVYSFFWTAASLVYLCLRHDVDGTPWEEIDPPGDPTSAQIRPVVTPPAAEDTTSSNPPSSD